jgi:predicted aldo/keto reductase-like oxidoreductase
LATPVAASRVSAAAPQARYRTLGKTGLKVSEVGFGTEAVSDISIYSRGLDLGINFFDTSRDYERGSAERMLGKALAARRKDVVFCSRSYAKGAKQFSADLDLSLKEAGTDYFDVFYIGAKDNPKDVPDDMLEAQAAAQKAGKIRFKGLSTHRIRAMEPLLACRHFDVILAPYNFTKGKFDYTPSVDEAAIEKCNKDGLGVVAMKVMAGGARFNRERNMPLKGFFDKNPGAHLSALKWALRTPFVHTTVPRMTNVEMLEENVRAMSERYGSEDEKILIAHLERIRPYVCRMCGACDGACPRGLPVSDLVRFVTYADGYGDFPMGYRRFQALPAEVRAVRCTDCRACAVRCPSGVHVRERLIRAQELFV